MNAPTLPQAALDYARRGWAVFPLKPRDKTPLTAHGVKDASADPARVKRWWTETPEANIGLACGPSGLVVVDLDVKPDADGRQTWASMGFHVTTATANTGGGGVHLLFSAPTTSGSIGNSAGRLGPGVDVRANGGYIVAPPSIHPSGRRYEWATATDTIAPLPEDLADLMRQPARPAADVVEDPWKLQTIADARKPRPPVAWLAKDVLAEGTLNIFYGGPGSMKSFLLADLCAAVVAGQRWLTLPDGSGGIATTPANVLWVDVDNGQRVTADRIAALANARKLPDHAGLLYVSLPDPAFVANDGGAVAALIGRMQANKIRLLVIDNLGNISGDAEENTDGMKAVMAGLRAIPEKTGAAVVVIHHQRKGGKGEGGRIGESLRGHSSIEAAIDTAILITRVEDTNEFYARPTKTRGAPVVSFGGVLACDNDADGLLTSAKFFGQPVRDLAAEAAEAAEAAVLACLEDGPKTSGDVKTLAGVRGAAALTALESLRRAGKITLTAGPRGAKIYTIA